MIISVCAAMGCLAAGSACYWVRRRRSARRSFLLAPSRPYAGKTFAADNEAEGDDGYDPPSPSAPAVQHMRRLPALAIPASDDAARRLRLLHSMGGAAAALPPITEDDGINAPLGVQRSASFASQRTSGRLPALMVPAADDGKRVGALANQANIQPLPSSPPPPLRAVQAAFAQSAPSSQPVAGVWQQRTPALMVPSADQQSRAGAVLVALGASVPTTQAAAAAPYTHQAEPAAVPSRLPTLMMPSGDARSRFDAILQASDRGAAATASPPASPPPPPAAPPPPLVVQGARPTSSRSQVRVAMGAFFSTRSNALYEDLEEEEESPRQPPMRVFSQP
jgi:hypothetical protein